MSDHDGMTERATTRDEPLARAADAARLAPSIHNTQPWRWLVGGGALELRAQRARQLVALDPDGRMLAVSCGAALHHARVAIAAQGYRCEVNRFPEGTESDLMARVVLGERAPVDPATMRLYQTTLVRQTDRRTVLDRPVEASALAKVARAAQAEGISFEPLEPDQVIELAVAVSRAESIEAVDAAQREELSRWVGGVRADGLGVPDTVIPSAMPRTTVPEREFGRAGTLPPGEGHDSGAVYAVLHGADDTPVDWLRAGEALSVVWLTAIEEGLSLLPFSAPIEIGGTREALRRLLSDLGHPYLVMRIGTADDQYSGPPHTPRLASGQVIEYVEG